MDVGRNSDGEFSDGQNGNLENAVFSTSMPCNFSVTLTPFSPPRDRTPQLIAHSLDASFISALFYLILSGNRILILSVER